MASKLPIRVIIEIVVFVIILIITFIAAGYFSSTQKITAIFYSIFIPAGYLLIRLFIYVVIMLIQSFRPEKDEESNSN